MKDEIETIVKTETGHRISISEWDDDGAWLSIVQRNFAFSSPLTRAEVQDLVSGFQKILDATK